METMFVGLVVGFCSLLIVIIVIIIFCCCKCCCRNEKSALTYNIDIEKNDQTVKQSKRYLNVTKVNENRKQSKTTILSKSPFRRYKRSRSNERKNGSDNKELNLRKKYKKINVGEVIKAEIKDYYTNNVVVDHDSRAKTKDRCYKIVCDILSWFGEDDRFSKTPDLEGSLKCGVKTGKADEVDFSVNIILYDVDSLSLSDDPFSFDFEDDIDSNCNSLKGKFARNGKRLLQSNRKRKRILNRPPESMQKGFKAVCLGDCDADRFSDCCETISLRNWLIPYYLLSTFYSTLETAVNQYNCHTVREDNAEVRLNKGAKGPAVTLTIEEKGFPTISVDLTPKIALSPSVHSLKNFDWPREETTLWLDDEKVMKNILDQQLYLVPKGDKYWKISFANCENALFATMKKTWRKGCLRLMKKKLSYWRSKSRTGLKGISSYHLKFVRALGSACSRLRHLLQKKFKDSAISARQTILLWLCEYLPEDKFWTEDQLANRYCTFLMELNYRLEINNIREYFYPDGNLLEKKDLGEIQEMREFIEREISRMEPF